MARTNRRDLSFATVNLLNLQSVGGLTYGAVPPFPDTPEGRAAYDRKIAWTGVQLRLLDAEVIGFQEVWSAAALGEAFAAAGLAGEYDLVARDAPGPGRPQVALAVRRDAGASQLLPGAHWEPKFPDGFRFARLRETDGSQEEITVTISEFSRPVLMARIQPAGTRPTPPEVALYVAHLKSKGPARLSFRTPPEALTTWPTITRSAVAHIRRVMEAGALRALLDAEMKRPDGGLSPTVLIGDLNDDSLSVTTELIAAEPGYRVIEKSTAGKRADTGLYSVERLQQLRSLRHVYYTHIFRNKMESLDHILVSEEFYDHAERRLWSFRDMVVLNDHLALDGPGGEAGGASDHGLVRAYFDWNPIPVQITS